VEYIQVVIDFILHIDVHLQEIINAYGLWTYAILFLIVFLETGIVVTPFLPGDSLLFAAGAFAALGSLDPFHLFWLLSVAAVLGDAANYTIGKYIGPRIFHKENVRFLNRAYLDRTHQFYERHGGKTIIIARYIPIIRTFAPFVAGIGKMTYAKFASYNIAGGVLWVASFVCAGYFFGNIPTVRNNFTLVIAAIIFISILPPVIEFLRHKFRPAGGA
jgi:membrane-associated protein